MLIEIHTAVCLIQQFLLVQTEQFQTKKKNVKLYMTLESASAKKVSQKNAWTTNVKQQGMNTSTGSTGNASRCVRVLYDKENEGKGNDNTIKKRFKRCKRFPAIYLAPHLMSLRLMSLRMMIEGLNW